MIATLAAAVLVVSACTRRGGGGGPTPPTTTPISTYYVDPVKGSDTTGDGSASKPYKTITKALKVVRASTTTGLTISLKAGVYNGRSGEIFPIVVPTGVVIAGNGYGRGPGRGSFINGTGEDTTLEKALGKPTKTLYTTIEIPSSVTSVSLDQLYVGAPGVLATGASYNSVDVLGTLNSSHVTFAAGSYGSAVGGVIVPSGTLTCAACVITGGNYAVEALSVSGASPPTVVLQGPGQSIVGGKGDGIRTDGTANINVSNQAFESQNYAYSDSLVPVASTSASPTPASTASPTTSPSSSPTTGPYGGVVDFGYGGNGSLGGNSLIGAKSEFFVTTSGAVITAFGNTWNASPAPGTQGANIHGQFPRRKSFGPGARGRNVTIATTATGAVVMVGPAPPPTPTPSPTPYGSASPSPSASPT